MKFYVDWMERRTTKMLLLGLLFGLSLVPGVSFFEIPTDNGPIPFSLVYLFSLVFAPYLLSKIGSWKLPPWYVTGLFAYVVVYAVIAAFRWGVSRSLLNWLYGAYLLLIVLNCGHDLVWADWKKLLGYAMLSFAAIHLLYVCLINGTRLIEPLQLAAAGDFEAYIIRISGIPSLTRGGRNLDATWLALGAYFVSDRFRLPYWAYAALFSLVTSSRVGILACGLFVVWLVIEKRGRVFKSRTGWIAAGCAAAAAVALLLVSGLGEMLWARMSGNGKGLAGFLAGRGGVWENAAPMFQANPFGYGCGNAMRVMRSVFGYEGTEGVVHNVALQFLLDEGVIGAVWFIGLAVAFLIREGRDAFRRPLAGYFLTYLVLSLVQFHGGESQMQFVLGVYLLLRVGTGLFPARPVRQKKTGEAA